jgi:hypothetical protein
LFVSLLVISFSESVEEKPTPVGFKPRITQTSSLPGHAFDQRNNR